MKMVWLVEPGTGVCSGSGYHLVTERRPRENTPLNPIGTQPHVIAQASNPNFVFCVSIFHPQLSPYPSICLSNSLDRTFCIVLHNLSSLFVLLRMAPPSHVCECFFFQFFPLFTSCAWCVSTTFIPHVPHFLPFLDFSLPPMCMHHILHVPSKPHPPEQCAPCLWSTPSMGRLSPLSHRGAETKMALLEELGTGACFGKEFHLGIERKG